MAERERVQKAVERPVAEAVKLLDETRGADTEKRLMMLINGWGRGLSAGLEELAIAIEEIRAGRPDGQRPDTREEPTADPATAPAQADEMHPQRNPRDFCADLVQFTS